MRFLFRLVFCRRHDDPVRLALIGFVAVLVLVVLHCATAEAARGRAPTVHPEFDAACVQGEVCAAPAVVYLDAWDTKADHVAAPAKRLRFSWLCGDQALPPNDGPLSKCVFEKPGTYTIWLRVERDAFTPIGATEPVPAETAFLSRTVTVIEPPPAQVLSDRAGCDRRGVGVVHCALPAGARVASLSLPTGPGVLTALPGAAPIVTGQVFLPDGWTVAGVHFEGGCLTVSPERSRITLLDVVATGCRKAAFEMQTGGGTKHNDLIAVVRSSLTNASGIGSPAIYARAERMVVTDSELDADYYPFRTVHFPGLLFSGNRLVNDTATHVCMQIRSWGGTGPPNTPSERFLVVDNECVIAQPAMAMARTCQNGTCEPSQPRSAQIRDGIFRGNTLRITGSGGLPTGAIGFLIDGADVLIEGNVIEALAADTRSVGRVALVGQWQSEPTDPLAYDGLEVRGNVARVKSGAREVVPCSFSFGGGHVCERNEIERR